MKGKQSSGGQSFSLFKGLLLYYYEILLSCNTLQEFYTDNPKTSEDYGRIINQRQFKRLMGLMEGVTIAFGGDADESQYYIGM